MSSLPHTSQPPLNSLSLHLKQAYNDPDGILFLNTVFWAKFTELVMSSKADPTNESKVAAVARFLFSAFFDPCPYASYKVEPPLREAGSASFRKPDWSVEGPRSPLLGECKAFPRQVANNKPVEEGADVLLENAIFSAYQQYNDQVRYAFKADPTLTECFVFPLIGDRFSLLSFKRDESESPTESQQGVVEAGQAAQAQRKPTGHYDKNIADLEEEIKHLEKTLLMPTVIFFCEPLYEEIWSQNVRQFHPTKKCLWALLHVVSNDENSKALFQPSFLVVLECSIDKDERRAKRAITNRFAKLKKTIIKEKKTQLRDFRHDNKNEVSVKQDSAYRSQSSQEGRARALYPRGQATVSRTQIQPEATSEDRPAPPEKGAGRSSTLAAMASDASRSSGAPTEIEQMDQGEQPALQPATAPRRSTRSTHSAGSSLSRFAPEPQA